jgi:hypothetical protein
VAGTVQLAFGSGGARAMAFAPLTGADERAAPGAVGLLRRLAMPCEGLVHGAAIDGLTVGDRDRALAALCAQLYGDGVLADAICTGCGATYEIRFNLSDLSQNRRPDQSAAGDPPTVSVGDSRLRLPVLADLTGAPEGFLERLTLEGPVPDAETAAPVLEAADPALELDLTGTCPECQATQATPFSISRFLEAALRRDLGFLAREVHLIASAYHWSLDGILGLSRAERQTYARLLIAEREAASSLMRRVS